MARGIKTRFHRAVVDGRCGFRRHGESGGRNDASSRVRNWRLARKADSGGEDAIIQYHDVPRRRPCPLPLPDKRPADANALPRDADSTAAPASEDRPSLPPVVLRTTTISGWFCFEESIAQSARLAALFYPVDDAMSCPTCKIDAQGVEESPLARTPNVERAIPSPQSSALNGLSLRANFCWTLVGNVVYAACQWGILASWPSSAQPRWSVSSRWGWRLRVR